MKKKIKKVIPIVLIFLDLKINPQTNKKNTKNNGLTIKGRNL